jgi:hypothetical protein
MKKLYIGLSLLGMLQVCDVTVLKSGGPDALTGARVPSEDIEDRFPIVTCQAITQYLRSKDVSNEKSDLWDEVTINRWVSNVEDQVTQSSTYISAELGKFVPGFEEFLMRTQMADPLFKMSKEPVAINSQFTQTADSKNGLKWGGGGSRTRCFKLRKPDTHMEDEG